jgi:broad specificity phosphatase PhoE
VLVRHAEKAAIAPGVGDPELSTAGQARAMRLATLLGSAQVSRLVATEYKRTQQTLAPLGAKLGKPVEVRKAAETRALAVELREAPPRSITVVATHSNVLPMLVKELGGEALRGAGADGMLAEDDYARVVILSVACAPSTLPTSAVVELNSD